VLTESERVQMNELKDLHIKSYINDQTAQLWIQIDVTSVTEMNAMKDHYLNHFLNKIL
jgi:hypothetical protein